MSAVCGRRENILANRNAIAVACSKMVDEIQQQDVNTWHFYRIAVILEYENKPTLAPPLTIISHLVNISSWCCAYYNKKRKKIIPSTTCDGN